MASNQLNINDLSLLLDVLAPIAYKFKRFGLKIDVVHSKLMELQNSNGECEDKLCDVLEYRLKQLPLLTWQDIVIALRSPTVNEPALASEIESKCLHYSSPQSQIVNTGSSFSGTSGSAIPSNKLPPAKRLCTETSTESLFLHFIDRVKLLYKASELEKRTNVLKLKTPGKCYINLAIIDRKTKGLRTEYDEITEAMVRDGNVDVIEGRKCPIDMNEIAKNIPQTTLESLVVVEGAPGVGKSTFAWEFCRRWERGEIAQQYDLVLLFRLRVKSIAIAKSWKDLIRHHSDEVRQAVVAKLEECGGQRVLLILEGYDELPESSRSDSSPLLQLISGEVLPFATIMITSRPWATRDILKNYSHRLFQHIEILGFTQAQVKLYIGSSLSKEEAIDLNKTLNEHPQILMCMYIPLNCTIVVTVYNECKENGESLPTTLTELYSRYTKMLLRRHLKSIDSSVTFINTFDNLPVDIKEQFSSVCELAYHGIAELGEQVKLIFTDIPDDFDNLGFMDSVFEFYESRKDIASHNFLHLTFQEFLAAVHISKMESDKRLSYFKRHSEGRLAVVLRFLAGLKKMSEFYCSSNLVPILKVEPRDNYVFEASIDYFIDNTLVSCLCEAGRDDLVKETLCQGKVVRYSNPTGSLDISALAFCIAHSHCEWVLSFNGKFEREVIGILAGELRSYSSVGGVVVGATECKGSSISEESFQLLIDKMPVNIHMLCFGLVINDENLFELSMAKGYFVVEYFYSEEISDKECETLSSFLPVFPDLNGLAFRDCGTIIADESIAIADFINESKQLESIFIMDRVDVECITNIFSAIEKNKYLPLKRLYLRGLSTNDESTMSSLVQLIKNRTQPLQLTLPYNISATHALMLVRAINDNPHLTEHYSDCFHYSVTTEKDAISLIELMSNYPEMCSVKDLFRDDDSVEKYFISREAIGFLATVLIFTNHTLSTLSLDHQKIEFEGAVIFSRVLSANTSLTKLDLSHSKISSDGAAALADGLRSNTTLTELNLSCNDIGNVGTISIAGALWSNSTLIELDISGNNISDDGAVALSVALNFNTALKTLDLSRNKIRDKGVLALFRAMLYIHCPLEKINLVLYPGVNITEDMLVSLRSCISSQNENEITLDVPKYEVNHTLKELILHIHYPDLDEANVLAQLLELFSRQMTLNLTMGEVFSDQTFQILLGFNVQKLELTLQLYDDDDEYGGGFSISMWSILSTNNTLVELDLGDSEICDDGVKALAQAITSNTTLEKLCLSRNEISDEGVVALAEALNFNRTLMTLDLYGNEIGDEGAKALAAVLVSDSSPIQQSPNKEDQSHQTHCGNTTLQELNLSDNKIGDDGAKSLAQSLHHNNSLKSLSLNSNHGIGREGMSSLIKALTVNKSITKDGDFNGLALDCSCLGYAFKCPEYDEVKRRIDWYKLD